MTRRMSDLTGSVLCVLKQRIKDGRGNGMTLSQLTSALACHDRDRVKGALKKLEREGYVYASEQFYNKWKLAGIEEDWSRRDSKKRLK